jgi:hypothetical protein
MLLQLIEILLNNNINRNYALEEGLPELLAIILLIVDPTRRNNEVTPVFKQALRVILLLCDYKAMLNVLATYKGAMDCLIGNLVGGVDNMLANGNDLQNSEDFLRGKPGLFDAEHSGSMICKIIRYVARDPELGEGFATNFPHALPLLVQSIVERSQDAYNAN